MFAQGRVLAGRRRPVDGLSMSRAVARLGVSSGVRQFVRFGYLQRNNQATHFAVPLGRFVVPDRTPPNLSCLDDLQAWIPRLRREARRREAPDRLVQVERRLADELFAVTLHPDEPQRWQNVLLCLAHVESVQLTGSGYKAGPIPRLRPEWAVAADDGSGELRLAVAFALQGGRVTRDRVALDGVRRHWVSLDGARYATSGAGAQQRIQVETDRVMQGRNGVDDAIAIVSRRLLESTQGGERRLPLMAACSAAASPYDLALMIAGGVDLDRAVSLARALMAISAPHWAQRPAPPGSARSGEPPDDAWLAIRLALLPWPLPDGRRIGTDPVILRRLEVADGGGAVGLALSRLRAAGINATVRVAAVPERIARLWAAALAFPITRHTAARFLGRLDPRSLRETAV